MLHIPLGPTDAGEARAGVQAIGHTHTHTHAQTALHSSRILHQVEPLFLLWAL